jgi:hypothetical protein
MEDEKYEELRMAQLDFEEEYFMHLYRVAVGGSRIKARTNYKVGESYIIKYTLSPSNAVITLDIPRDLYNKVDNYVTCHDVDTLQFNEIDEILEKENE